ncbi:glycosyltransferase family 1 protein [Hydrogenophaga sp.]|uniref:glycosyltransferase n=1 Tax=Hydrogenophaga sp. TaxID=1904254 RepID=UPI0025C4DDDA|nr:glycosyltransferase family 1 protein [Hydrogenophaga sp.]MBT9463097.1 glycosyltransferase family 4 protein [Hydrogenophaga sp.]
MRIVLFTHPPFMASQSMPRFARMLQQAYQERGHEVHLWAPQPLVHRWVPAGRWSKWAGYIDQYLLFPLRVRREVAKQPADTLFVMADQALGPWVPRVKHRALVVHVHDLLALRSALGEVPQNPTGFTGRLYQRYIRWGFAQARHFICTSQRTRSDLQRVGGVAPDTAEVVYNGLNQRFARTPSATARSLLRVAGLPVPDDGLLLHVSGNQWYKNVIGILHIYARYAAGQAHPLPLWLVGVPQTDAVRAALAAVPPQGKVHFLYGIDHALLQAAYSLARAFLFPSLAEGFGWPIVEAQACGCPVITTDDSPMNEIGGPNAVYLPLLGPDDDRRAWAAQGATALNTLLCEPAQAAAERAAACVAWSRRFEANLVIDQYLQVYQRVLTSHLTPIDRALARAST